MVKTNIFSDKWFDMIKKTTAKIGELNMTPAMRDICLNIIVKQENVANQEKTTTDSEQSHALHFADGIVLKGLQEDAKTTMSVNYATMKELLVDVDMNKATQAFINGDIQVSGDMSQLMALQMTKVSEEQKVLFKTILDNTKV